MYSTLYTEIRGGGSVSRGAFLHVGLQGAIVVTARGTIPLLGYGVSWQQTQ
jgi:hypothetical protein